MYRPPVLFEGITQVGALCYQTPQGALPLAHFGAPYRLHARLYAGYGIQASS